VDRKLEIIGYWKLWLPRRNFKDKKGLEGFM